MRFFTTKEEMVGRPPLLSTIICALETAWSTTIDARIFIDNNDFRVIDAKGKTYARYGSRPLLISDDEDSYWALKCAVLYGDAKLETIRIDSKSWKIRFTIAPSGTAYYGTPDDIKKLEQAILEYRTAKDKLNNMINI